MNIATLWLIFLILSLISTTMSIVSVGLWLAAGAGAAMVAALMGAPLWLQILLFVLLSAPSLFSLIPLLKKSAQSTGSFDAFIGARGTVTQQIDNQAGTGSVRLGSSVWVARSATGAVIPAGAAVAVERVEGERVFVLPVC